MTTKSYLSQIIRLDKMIQNKLSEINQLKTMACGTSISSDTERVQTSSEKDKIGLIVSKIVDMEKEVEDMVNKRSLIVSQIDEIENTDFYDTLAKRYILGKDLKVMAVERNITFRYMGMIHKNAIKAFEKKYGKTYLQ